MTAPGTVEQYVLELVNRARSHPDAEAARLGIGLDDGLPEPIPPGPKAPLAINPRLVDSARAHSGWMLEEDVFSHTGVDGTGARDRIEAAGYALEAPWATGENIAWLGVPGRVDLRGAADDLHDSLVESPGHRANIFSDSYSEVGIGIETGRFTLEGVEYDSAMLTQNFATSGGGGFVSGVLYEDRDGDGFYTPGEGTGGVPVASGGTAGATWASGGYTLPAVSGGPATLALGDAAVRVELGRGESAKVDLVDGTAVHTTTGVTVLSGAERVVHLGLHGGASTGHDGPGEMIGGPGADTLDGAGGPDVIEGGAGDDHLIGGAGRDTLDAGPGRDTLDGGAGDDLALYDAVRGDVSWRARADGGAAISADTGRDVLFDVERIRFADGDVIRDLDGPDLAYAYRLYAAAFARTPDEAGLRYWAGMLDAGAMDREEVADAFVESPEFARLFGAAPSDDAFVRALYGNVLKREPDADGLEFWVDAFASGGESRADMLEHFAESAENVARTAPDLEIGAWVSDPLDA